MRGAANGGDEFEHAFVAMTLGYPAWRVGSGTAIVWQRAMAQHGNLDAQCVAMACAYSFTGARTPTLAEVTLLTGLAARFGAQAVRHAAVNWLRRRPPERHHHLGGGLTTLGIAEAVELSARQQATRPRPVAALPPASAAEVLPVGHDPFVQEVRARMAEGVPQAQACVQAALTQAAAAQVEVAPRWAPRRRSPGGAA